MTRPCRAVITALAWLTPALLSPVELRAQDRTERAVRAVVDSFFAAVAREQWDSAATLIDLPRFEPILKQHVASARSAIPRPPATPEQFMAEDSTMPRAVAEWEAARSNRFRSMHAFDDYSSQFAGVTSQRILFSLSLPDAVARWLAARDQRVQIREGRRRAGCPLGDIEPWPYSKPALLAIAVEDDSTAFVIQSDDRFRGEAYMSTERLIPVRRTRSGWRIEPRNDLLSPTNVSFSSECSKK